MTANQRFAAELFPQHTKHSGAAAVMRAADDVAAVADWKRQVIDVLGLSQTMAQTTPSWPSKT